MTLGPPEWADRSTDLRSMRAAQFGELKVQWRVADAGFVTRRQPVPDGGSEHVEPVELGAITVNLRQHLEHVTVGPETALDQSPHLSASRCSSGVPRADRALSTPGSVLGDSARSDRERQDLFHLPSRAWSDNEYCDS